MDPTLGITVTSKTAWISLSSPNWEQTGQDWFKELTWSYKPPGHPWKNVEWAIMHMADWNKDKNWSSAQRRLNTPLGFGRYVLSIKVGTGLKPGYGAGLTTTFYLCGKDIGPKGGQEIDFEFSGHQPDGTSWVWTNVWHNKQQYGEKSKLWSGAQANTLPNSTQGCWPPADGDPNNVYRYMIDWQPNTVTWWVNRVGHGDNYEKIRSQDVSGFRYREDECYVFISFWNSQQGGWSPDGSQFNAGTAPTSAPDQIWVNGATVPCFNAFYFQSLEFTPGPDNKITRLLP
jgi:hypothetical protein